MRFQKNQLCGVPLQFLNLLVADLQINILPAYLNLAFRLTLKHIKKQLTVYCDRKIQTMLVFSQSGFLLTNPSPTYQLWHTHQLNA